MKSFDQHILENLETYKDLFDNAHDLIHIVEPDGRILYVNNAWKRLLGYEQDQFQSKSIYSFIEPSNRDRFIQYRTAILSGAVMNEEIIVRFITKSGRSVFLEGFVSAKTVEGRAMYTSGIFRDVTQKLQHEAELKERESNLQHLLFYAPDAVIVIDAGSYVTYWNPKAESIFGWKSDEVIGKPLSDLIIPSKYREAHNKGMKRYLSTGEAHVLNKTIEITAINKEGREFYVSLTISTTLQRGEVAFIAFIRDIDEQKRNAIELEQKREQLEISNSELEQFAHVVSHDIKEPIRKILFYINFLDSEAKDMLSASLMTHLEKVNTAALRLSAMVDGVLAYSSLNGSEFLFEEVDLGEIIKGVEEDLELIIRQKGAVIQYDDLAILTGASVLLYQLFYNLIYNALKFSHSDRTPLIEITANKTAGDELQAYPVPSTKDYHKILVKDNGIGFAPRHAEKIFKTFTRLYSKDK